MQDLLWLRTCGLEAASVNWRPAGPLYWGVCGGYQMLGEPS